MDSIGFVSNLFSIFHITFQITLVVSIGKATYYCRLSTGNSNQKRAIIGTVQITANLTNMHMLWEGHTSGRGYDS